MAKRNTRRVKLEQLFRWKRELPIKDHDGKVVGKVYQRVLNDRDTEKARLSAVRKSREMRLALRDETADEYAALMESVQNYGLEQLISIILLDKLPDLYEHARRQAGTQMPKRPGSGAKLEEVEEYEAAVDTFEKKFEEEVLKIVDQHRDKEREQLEKLEEDDLRKTVLKSLENQICRNVVSSYLDEMFAYMGTYSNAECTTHYFSSMDEFDQLASEVKRQLIEGYRELTLTRGELKN